MTNRGRTTADDNTADRLVRAGPGRRRTAKEGEGERGSSNLFLILTVVTLIVLVGLVVDGAGKVQTSAQAQHVAASAARAATGALAAGVIEGEPLAIDAATAEQAALDYVAAAGMTGTAEVSGDTITVSVETSYETLFVSLIGVSSLPAGGTATAQLIDGTGEGALDSGGADQP